MSLPPIERQCEKCAKLNIISLATNYFICSKCGHKNVYDNEAMKQGFEDLFKKVKKERFKNPKNN